MRAMWHHFCIGLICQNCIAHSVLVLIVLSMILLNSFSLCVLVKRYCYNPACIYLLEVNNRNTRKRWEICSKLTIKTPELIKTTKTTARRNWRRFGDLMIKFKHIPHLLVVLLLLNLSMHLFAENCPSKRILILILKDRDIIHMRYITYTVLDIKLKYYKWNVKLSIRKGRRKGGTKDWGKKFQMKEENKTI